MQLTRQQAATVGFIREFKRRHGYAPTVRELADGLGLRSTSAVSYRLWQLRDLGVLTFVDGEPRTIVLAEERNGGAA